MKMRTLIGRNADRGFSPVIAIDAKSHDYVVRASVGEVPMADLVADVAAAVEAAGPDGLGGDGGVAITEFGYEVTLPRRLAEYIALYDPTDHRISEMVGLVYLAARTNFREARLDVCVRDEFDAYRAIQAHDMPMPLVEPTRFAAACSEAIAAGRVSVTNAGGEGARRAKQPSLRTRLCEYLLDVDVSGVRRSIRLDIAMALVKRADRLPVDAYGDRIEGVTFPLQGANARRWQVSYVVPGGATVPRTDVANIDHVYPQSLGGRTRLCNLQVMRASANARKSSEIFVDVSGEPMRSANVVISLIRGIRAARRDGTVPAAVCSSVLSICKRELAACLDFVRGDESCGGREAGGIRQAVRELHGARRASVATGPEAKPAGAGRISLLGRIPLASAMARRVS